ncbi:MAG: hypothetical protein Kow0029_17900 [Candidatus Rifleibacteriota bacterium]
MKRNLFWTVWGLVTLVCVMIAGFKSFALELEKKNSGARTEKAMPQYFAD